MKSAVVLPVGCSRFKKPPKSSLSLSNFVLISAVNTKRELTKSKTTFAAQLANLIGRQLRKLEHLLFGNHQAHSALVDDETMDRILWTEEPHVINRIFVSKSIV